MITPIGARPSSAVLGAPAFATFQDAYLAVLRHISEGYTYRNAPRGNASRETLGVSFQLTDPRQRLVTLAERRANPVYHLAEALWYLAGRSDVAMISHYAPRRRADSRDGVSIDGSAYGARLFAPGAFDQVLRLLRSERDSKRAVLPVFRPSELADPGSPDVPCLLALHLLVREGRLHMVCYMRANDADRGLLADVFSFTFIQEFTARLLGLELGTYTHHAGSMHLGEADLPRVERVLAAGPDEGFAVPSMPTGTDLAVVEELLGHEAALRTNQLRLTARGIGRLGLDPYWAQALLLFEAHRQITYQLDEPVDASVLRALEPGLRQLVARRWPARMPGGVLPW